MAMNTYQTYLMYSADGTTYTSLCDIKDYPDVLNDVNTIDVTSLSDDMHHYIPDIKDVGGDMTFTANYDKAKYTAIRALEGTIQKLGIYFGQDGADGKWTFEGYVTVGVSGKGVGDAREMTIHVIPDSDFTFA